MDFNLFSKGKKRNMSYRNWINYNMILHQRKTSLQRRSIAKIQTGKVGKKKKGVSKHWQTHWYNPSKKQLDSENGKNFFE